MRSFAPVALLFLLEAATACAVPPASIRRDNASLLAEARSVALVEIVPVVGRKSSCALRILRSWKAITPTPLSVFCRAPAKGDWMTDFDGHTDPDFWQGRMGRLGVSGDCSVIAPAFSVGKIYVVLVGVAPDTKQYEQIASSEDAWLRFVEQTLTESGK